LQSPPAHAGTDANITGQIAPTRAGFEDPKNAFQHDAVVFGRTAAPTPFELGQKRFNLLPLFFGEQWFSHDHFLANRTLTYKFKVFYRFNVKTNLETTSSQ
jgi:hypothetical protein